MAVALSADTQKLLDSMMSKAGLNHRQRRQVKQSVGAGAGLPSRPAEIMRDGNRQVRPPAACRLPGALSAARFAPQSSTAPPRF